VNPIQQALVRYFHHIYRDVVDRLLAAEAASMEPGGRGRHLDLGSHAGENAARLAAAAHLPITYGIDYDPNLLQEGWRARGIRGVQADLNRPLPWRSNAFAAATVTDVIEHLIATTAFLSELYRILEPGGYAVLATPNLAAWHNVFALVLGLQPFSGPSVTDMTDGEIDLVRRLHRRAYEMPEEGETERPDAAETVHRHLVVLAQRTLVNTLIRQGFLVESVRGYGYYPLPPLLARLAERLDVRHSVHLLIKVRKPGEDRCGG